MKRGLRSQESVTQFLAFVNGSVDEFLAVRREFAEENAPPNASPLEAMGRTESEVARVHERAKALANLLAKWRAYRRPLCRPPT